MKDWLKCQISPLVKYRQILERWCQISWCFCTNCEWLEKKLRSMCTCTASPPIFTEDWVFKVIAWSFILKGLSSCLSIHPVLDGVSDGWSLLFVNIHSYMYMDPCRDTAHAWIWEEWFFFEEIVKNFVCPLRHVLVLHVLVLLTSVVVGPY